MVVVVVALVGPGFGEERRLDSEETEEVACRSTAAGPQNSMSSSVVVDGVARAPAMYVGQICNKIRISKETGRLHMTRF